MIRRRERFPPARCCSPLAVDFRAKKIGSTWARVPRARPPRANPDPVPWDSLP
jgi:hypothetical protein